MRYNTGIVLKLLDLLKEYAEIIKSQESMLTELINENLEKENMVNELLKDIEES